MVIKETSKELLIAEYDRLKTLEQNRIETYEHAQQFYLTTITAAGGIIIFLLENNPSGTIPLSVLAVLGIILLLGEVTYLRLVNGDIELLEISKRYQLIRDKFIEEDAKLADSFPKILVQSPERFRSWSSLRGIISRAASATGVKTTVVLLNCIVTVAMFVTILLPETIWLGLVTGLSVATLVAIVHIAHASWRYRNISKQLAKGVISWWM